MKIISMKQLRENFTPVLRSLRKGQKILLLYRSKPLAILTPYQEKNLAAAEMAETPPPLTPPQPAAVSAFTQHQQDLGSVKEKMQMLDQLQSTQLKPGQDSTRQESSATSNRTLGQAPRSINRYNLKKILAPR